MEVDRSLWSVAILIDDLERTNTDSIFLFVFLSNQEVGSVNDGECVNRISRNVLILS